MFSARRPSQHTLNEFLARSTTRSLSYGDAGLLRRVEAAALVETTSVIGQGREDFDRAKAALKSWRQFELGWVTLLPPAAPIEPGVVVAVCIRHLGFWSLNGARIVDRAESSEAFGYTYGTLTNHAESGEELFEVRIDATTSEVVYRICATATPQAALAKMGGPIVRVLQARFRRDSAAALRRAVRG